jgi:hypothetical protein
MDPVQQLFMDRVMDMMEYFESGQLSLTAMLRARQEEGHIQAVKFEAVKAAAEPPAKLLVVRSREP